MTAREVKDALRARHPARMNGSMVGQWTCLEEWANVDLLAFNAWRQADVVGYEVKVSRSDYRQELLAPAKREAAVAMCTEFYFAVPAGLLKPDELAFDEPEWQPEDWQRARCPGVPTFGPPDEYAHRRHRPANLLDRPPGRYGGQCRGRGWTGTYKAGTREKGPFTVRLPVPLVAADVPEYIATTWRDGQRVPQEGQERTDALLRWAHADNSEAERAVPCPRCAGKGYLDRSRVELEAPTLWVPRDVGLIEVDGRGCRVVRRSPKRPKAPGLLPVVDGLDVRRQRQALAQIIRWASNRPDPRHLPSAFEEAA